MVIILAYYKFDISEVSTKLIVVLLVNASFICKNYKLVNLIFLLKSLIVIFDRDLGVFLL